MTSKLTINYNGKELHIPVELNESQIRQIYLAAEADTKMTGWEKPSAGGLFFYEDGLCRVQSLAANEHSMMQLNMLYDAANCYSSETIANNISRGDALIRELRRFAITSRTKPFNRMEGGYTITYNYKDNCLECGFTGNWLALGDVIFESEEHARIAMNTYASELIWYFTEMKETL